MRQDLNVSVGSDSGVPEVMGEMQRVVGSTQKFLFSQGEVAGGSEYEVIFRKIAEVIDATKKNDYELLKLSAQEAETLDEV